MVKREKDLERFWHVYAENKDIIFKIVMRYSNMDYDTAQDITQEVFVKLYEHFDTYTEEYLLQWLIVAARHEVYSYLRKILRERPDEAVDMHLLKGEQIPSAEETIFERIEAGERIRRGGYLLDRLYETNERWYEAMMLVYVKGMKQADVADEMGSSLEVLHSVLYRARKWVREHIKPDNE